MKIKILKIILLIPFCLQAQLIQVSNSKILALVFPANVTSAIVGTNAYTVEYNTEKPEPIIFIKAKFNADESNLIVKTEGNILYNYTLQFTKETAKNSIVIKKEDGIYVGVNSIQNENNISLNNENNTKGSIRENFYTIGNTTINDADRKEVNCDICPNLLKEGKYIKRVSVSKYDIKLTLENVYYRKNKLLIVINLENKSTIDFYINFIKTYLQQQKGGGVSSAQYLELNPTEIYNTNRTVEGKKERRMIFIYDQFTIDKNKNLIFELNEASGERNLSLEIPNYIINNPIKINNN